MGTSASGVRHLPVQLHDDSTTSHHSDGHHGSHYVGSQSDIARLEKVAEILGEQDDSKTSSDGHNGSHQVGRQSNTARLEKAAETLEDEDSFMKMRQSEMWAKIEEVEKMLESYKGKHKEKIEQAREEKMRWSEDWEKCQRDGKKLSAMSTKVRQLKQIANGGSHIDDMHLESKSGIRVNEKNFKAMSKSRQWAKIEEVEAIVDSFRTKHARHLEKVRAEKKHWLEEAENLQQHFEKLNDMRSKLRTVKQLSYK